MQEKSKINLIYIASTGRSGSTLLDMILGAHSQIATAGEIQILPHEIIQNGLIKPCSCGKAVTECSFWKNVYKSIDLLNQPHPQIHFFREKHNAGKSLRWKYIQQFFQTENSQKIPLDIQNYGMNNYRVFKAFLDRTERTNGIRPKWIVDASKDPYRLLWLVRSNLFNIKVLHIVKDPRAFTYSMTKNILNTNRHYQAMIFTVTKPLSWLVHNYLINRIIESYLEPSSSLLVNYEKLASNPKQTVDTILNFLGCNFEETCITNFRKQEIHAIAGNMMRSEKKGIVLDEAWKESFPHINQKIVELITNINKSQYGY